MSRKDGEGFDYYVVKPLAHAPHMGEIWGVRKDGYEESFGISTMEVSDVLAGAYNAGGYTTHHVQKVRLGKPKAEEE